MKNRVLIADDEPSIRAVLRAQLGAAGFSVEAVADGAEAISALERQTFHALITDQRMPHVDGLALLAWVRANQPELPVILITAYGTVDAAKEAIKLGAYDYLTKPFEQEELKRIIAKAVAAQPIRAQAPSAELSHPEIVGKVPTMRQIFNIIAKVADSPTTVLITGESGTGKELVARALHDQSSRKNEPFVTVNCGAIPEGLFEAELFGHERGAFTGAHAARPGRFELADGGTLFLDEVGELPLDLQVKLLRVLQERSFERVGGVRPLSVDVRLVAATNRDLREAIERREFRQDLFYRLNVVSIHVPPLRDRREDVPLMVQHFLQRFNERLGRNVSGVSEAALAALAAYHWPGNIRELENLMERCVLLCDGERIEEGDLPELGEPVSRATREAEDLSLKEYLRLHMSRLEANRIREALGAEENNVTRAARRLGISRKSLQTKMKDYGLREA